VSQEKYRDQFGNEGTIRCSRCGKVCRRAAGWNSMLKGGAVTGFLCPTCQAPDENAEAEINEATLTYGQRSDYGFVAKPEMGGYS
jgi:hypothetical protein